MHCVAITCKGSIRDQGNSVRGIDKETVRREGIQFQFVYLCSLPSNTLGSEVVQNCSFLCIIFSNENNYEWKPYMANIVRKVITETVD